jgi:hypothetical protein
MLVFSSTLTWLTAWEDFNIFISSFFLTIWSDCLDKHSLLIQSWLHQNHTTQYESYIRAIKAFPKVINPKHGKCKLSTFYAA